MAQPDRIDINPALVPPLAPASPATRPDQPGRTADGQTFKDVLRSKVAQTVAPAPQTADEAAPAAPGADINVRFSAHAMARLRQRNIDLSPAQMQRLGNAVDRASAKGSKDALVMLDGTAMVCSIKNRTVITALHQDQARENVFTNIDSAVIA
jgi:flagellar operon protein